MRIEHSRLVVVDADFQLPTFAKFCAVHPRSVEAPSQLAVRRDGDDAAIAVNRVELLVDDLVGGLLQGHAFEVDQIADLARDAEANEVLASAGGGDSAGLVGGVGARADDGRVAYASPLLGLCATGGCACGDIALSVESDDADGAVFVRIRWFDFSNRRGRRRRVAVEWVGLPSSTAAPAIASGAQ